ncbi:glycosyltransferase family protein [Desulfatirhabdium butyrativorans]|uniref:glycosyltransferase family protein n=1 Tax=Desulfatirhabdium butyrativorans TaxID=340467 RepID=UPI0003FB61C9|nr:glycosyltransferase [Desulfatirhabdium butyrativorans]
MYCQHVLGIGHFFRTLEICRHLVSHDVVLIVGGTLPDLALPSHIRSISLPALMMDQNFTSLHAPEPTRSVSEILQQRKAILFNAVREERPDMFVIELYPFGRKAFRFELDPVLESIASGQLPRSTVICSLRDILVEKKDTRAYEERVIRILNRWFDGLLVHADPDWISLDETFSRVKDIAPPVVYTGFVAQRPTPGDRERIRQYLELGASERLIVISAGGGNVGGKLCEATTAAFRFLPKDGGFVGQVFTGPFLDEADFRRIGAIAPSNVQVDRFTPEFPAFLAAADLSISMAGYNTCMNILATGVRALVLPFSQNREQEMRANRLADKGFVSVLQEADLVADRLAERILAAIESWPERSEPPCLEGASKTASILEKMNEKGAIRRIAP